MNKLLKVLKAFTSSDHTKAELRYVFYDALNRKLVASNKNSILVVSYDLGLTNNLMIDVNELEKDNKPVAVIGKYLAYKEKNIMYFPTYQKFLITRSRLTKPINSKLSFAECLLNAGAITREPIVVKFNKEYSKLHLPQENTRIHYNNPKEAFMLSGLVDFGNKNKKRIILPTKLVIASVFKQNIW